MIESFLKRTHTCGELRKEHDGQIVVLNGWVDNWRDHGGVRFIDLRDRYGKTQIVFDLEKTVNTFLKDHKGDAKEEKLQKIKEYHAISEELKREFVLSVKGKVHDRPQGMVNKKMATGEIEILAEEIQILNPSKTTPFVIGDDGDISEDIRLKWRYLDLRRQEMRENIILRHKCAQSIRRYFDARGFIEIETPMLMKSTPEGARDYLVPSRVFPGSFYALPQSPQTYKQILMVAGFDKYFQIVKCFRDEDLRADRQPEFTQLDMEMSFVNEEDIYSTIEGSFKALFKDVLAIDLKIPIERLSYEEAMNTYGTDKPDLRWHLPITDISAVAEKTSFKVFSDTVSNGGTVRGLVVKGEGSLSRKGQDELTDFAKNYGAKGLVALKMTEEGIQGGVAKFFDEAQLQEIAEALEAKPGDLILIVADSKKVALNTLGNLRLEVIKRFNIPAEKEWSILWVTEFPLFEQDDETGEITPTHHPFTSPVLEDMEYLFSEPLKVRSRAYDIVLNGYELGSGSIRIHDRKLQETVFEALKIDKETAEKKFGFLLSAFEYGAPPHGGIALGFDRIAMLFAGETSIREVIAFPKTNKAYSPMVETPSQVDPEQLKDLGIAVLPQKE